MWSTTTATTPPADRPRAGWRHDAAIAAAVLACSLALLSHGGLRPGPGAGWSPPGAADLDLTGIVLAAGTAAPLVAWRRSPLGAFTVTAAASASLTGLGYSLDVALGPAVALYLLTAHRSRDTPWTRRTTVAVAGPLVAYLAAAAAGHGAFPAAELLHSSLAWAVAWFAGERTRLRRLHIADLQERAQRAERDAERERRLAAAEERARIARDLHDSAGHAISVIALRAGAARLRHHEHPDRSLSALEAIEDLARRTADEIDHIVGTLRDADPPVDPPVDPPDRPVDPPLGLASLDTLVTHHRAAGLAVTVTVNGSDAPRPAAAADRAAYRILQEALTNAARHGTGRAQVDLAFGHDAVELTVTNPTAPANGHPGTTGTTGTAGTPGTTARPNGGHGLLGMRERVTLLGGDLQTQRTNGTFRVRALIPYGAHCP